MKTEGHIKQKVKQASFRHMKRRIEDAMSPKAANCVYNKALEATSTKQVIGVCTCPEASIQICDDVLGSPAKSCPYFTASADPEDIKAEFQSFLETASLAEIALEYPDIAALLWVLDRADLIALVSEDEVSKPDSVVVTVATTPVSTTPSNPSSLPSLKIENGEVIVPLDFSVISTFQNMAEPSDVFFITVDSNKTKNGLP